MVRRDESVTLAMTEVNGEVNGIDFRLVTTGMALKLDKLADVGNASEAVVEPFLSADEVTAC